jgi:hypothetical protein
MKVTVKLSDGLGNRFFQVAAMLDYAQKNGHAPTFVKEWISENKDHPGPTTILDYFPSIPVIDTIEGHWGNITASEAFVYKSLPPCLNNNICLSGFFQSIGYLQKYIKCPAILEKPTLQNHAFLHVCRGDYLSPDHTQDCVDLEDYYRNALCLYDPDTRILVCSDDIAGCKATLPRRYSDIVKPHRWVFVNEDDVTTLGLMTACEYGGICANSTFSWWGAYWNSSPQKLICMPKTWGEPPMPVAKEIYPEGTIVL